MEKDPEEKGFVIKDKRMFDKSGEVRPMEPGKAEEKKTVEEEQPPKREAEEKPLCRRLIFPAFCFL
jgi:hypothetical protein